MGKGIWQDFAWVEQANSEVLKIFHPSDEYAALRPAAAPKIEVTHLAKGRYTVAVGWHDTFQPYQAQVVTYGTDNVRCKFGEFAEPTYVGRVGTTLNLSDWKSRMYVKCVDADGNLVDSRFVFSFSGRAVSATHKLRGPAAYFETTMEGEVTSNYVEVVEGAANGPFDGVRLSYCRDPLNFGLMTPDPGFPGGAVPNPDDFVSTGLYKEGAGFMSYNSSPDNPLPEIRRTSTGIYDVRLPGLGTPNPGLVQVTAIGSGSAHCVAGLPIASSPGSDLRVRVEGWRESKRVNTGFVLNYDEGVTRYQLHQGARVYADNWLEASYTPARSDNTGTFVDAPGTNTAYRIGTGRYRVHHTNLRVKPNSVWAGAAPAFELLGIAAPGGSYCKVEKWVPKSTGTDVYIRCYDAEGKLADSRYYETYQGHELRAT